MKRYVTKNGFLSLRQGPARAFLIFSLLFLSGSAHAQISADHWNGGAVRVGPSATVCNAAAEGSLRWNAANKNFEMCNGTTWKAIVASSNLALLVITPAAQGSMDISASGTPAYGSYKTFTVENAGNVTSQTLSVSLGNAANFEIGTNTCTGNTLASAATCTITVRPRAWGDGSYNGALIINADTTVIATLSGTATGSCGAIGSALGGGLLGACMSGYALIAMPAGCPDNTGNPACTGTIDTLSKNYGPYGTLTNANSLSNGQDISGGNTYILMARVSVFGESFPAAQYCADMDYGGHTDWYLPSYEELRALCLNQSNLPGFITSACGGSNCSHPYVTSTEDGPGGNKRVYFNGGNCAHYCSNGDCAKSASYPVRCVRRQ